MTGVRRHTDRWNGRGRTQIDALNTVRSRGGPSNASAEDCVSVWMARAEGVSGRRTRGRAEVANFFGCTETRNVHWPSTSINWRRKWPTSRFVRRQRRVLDVLRRAVAPLLLVECERTTSAGIDSSGFPSVSSGRQTLLADTGVRWNWLRRSEWSADGCIRWCAAGWPNLRYRCIRRRAALYSAILPASLCAGAFCIETWTSRSTFGNVTCLRSAQRLCIVRVVGEESFASQRRHCAGALRTPDAEQISSRDRGSWISAWSKTLVWNGVSVRNRLECRLSTSGKTFVGNWWVIMV